MRVRFAGPLLAAAAPAVLIAALLFGSIPDEEELRWVVLSTFLHVRSLAHGTLLTWTSDLGFGMPLPMVPNFNLYPLAPLLAVVSTATWVRLLYIVQTLVAALGMWRLCRRIGITPLTAGVCVFSFILATPTLNYAVSDFWPSFYMMWTLSPWLVILAWRLLDPESLRSPATTSLGLGIVGGLGLASTHPSYSPLYGVVVVAILVAHSRAVLACWRWLLLSGALALIIAAPAIVQLVEQRAVFDPAFAIVKYVDPLPLSALRDVFIRPFSFTEHPWEVEVVSRGSRLLFFGGPFAVLALAGLVRFWRRRLDLAVGVILAAVLLFTRLLPLTFVSRFEFRDPLTLCAIPLAGLMVDDLLARRSTRGVALGLLVLQLGVVGAAASPFLETMWSREATRATWFRGATGDAPFVDGLNALMPTPGRIVYSPQLDEAVSVGERLQDGLGVNALAFRGLAVVNGSFKVISNDVVWPDDRLYYGRIRVPRAIIQSREALDLLGIRYVLTNPGEPVAPGLREIRPMPSTIGAPLALYENETASAGALVMEDEGQLPPLPTAANCPNDRLLCRDFGPLTRLRRVDRVAVTRQGPTIDVDLEPAATPRVLILVEMFRPQWIATAAGRTLTTLSVGPGLIGVRIPAGITAIRLEYRTTLVRAVDVASWSALAAGLVALLAASRRPRVPRPHTS